MLPTCQRCERVSSSWCSECRGWTDAQPVAVCAPRALDQGTHWRRAALLVADAERDRGCSEHARILRSQAGREMDGNQVGAPNALQNRLTLSST